MGIDAIPLETHNFAWDISFTFSTSSQVVERLLDGQPIKFTDYDVLMPDFIIKEGEPVGNIYGYKALGKWTTADDTTHNPFYVNQGRMKYYSPDTSKKNLSDNDKVIIGHSIPKYTWHLENSIQYRNINLDFTWYAVWGVQKFNSTRAAMMITNNSPDIKKFVYDTLTTIKYRYFYESSEFIDNASFIRLKTVTLTYTPQQTFIGNIRWKFSLSLENIITITKYRGYDPEATIFTDNNFSDNAVDKGAYPNPKAFYISVGLTF